MIRLSLMIVATLLLLIASVSGYQMWLASQKSAIAVPPPPAPAVHATNQPAVAAAYETNATMPAAAEPQAVSKPPKEPAVAKQDTTPPAVSLARTPLNEAGANAPGTGRLLDVSAPSKTAFADPIEAYQNQPNYGTALAVARDFYANSNFVDAAVWAKKANQLNREGEEAWLLYAKSYYAQGRKNEAIGVLELYLNYKDSRAAMELLRTWKTSGE